MSRFVGIDPSTKTGLVILDGDKVETEIEITTKVKTDPQRFLSIADHIVKHLKDDDVICIEGFSFGSKGKGVSTQYGIGWLIRAELIKSGYSYYEVSPGALKKFATGKGTTKKDEMVLPIYKRWGYEGATDNIRDAFVLAQIAKAIDDESGLTAFQKDVMKKVKACSKE